MSDKISLAGDLGSGKSTVSRILVEKLGLTYYSTGTVVRAMASEHGMTVVEFNEYMEKHPELDREIDDRLIALSDDPRALIIDSRMAFHFVRDTFRVYFSTELETSAARILGDHRAEESFATLEETAANIKRRKASERKRYSDFYGVDCKDLSKYSLVIDTTYATPAEVSEALTAEFDEWKKDHARCACLLSPLRLYYPEDTSPEEAARRAEALDCKEQIALPTVIEEDGCFYLTDHAESAMAYAISDRLFCPCRLKKGNKKDIDYVRMSNSL